MREPSLVKHSIKRFLKLGNIKIVNSLKMVIEYS